MTPSVVLDCTQLFNMPVATGIQRVVRRLVRHWPNDGPDLHVARYDPAHGLVRISGDAMALLQDAPAWRGGEAAQDVHDRLVALSPPQQPALPATAPVLLPEIFFDADRIRFYEAMLGDQVRPVAMLAYDFMPYLHPSLFETRSVSPLMGYLRLMTLATNVAFISGQTRREYTARIVRRNPSNAGPVLRLGSDGLLVPKQEWHPGRDSFVCIGTIEKRKNLDLVARCFQDLWRSGRRERLVVIGHHFGPALPAWLVEVMDHPSFTWINAASDDEIAQALRSARATIFASETEGFGLPPVESLDAGIPVITYAGVPSLEGIGSDGQLRLPTVTVDSLAAAVSSLGDDNAAKALWQGVNGLELPGWSGFAHQVATWCSGLAHGTPPG